MKVDFTTSAKKQLKRISKTSQIIIVRRIHQLESDQFIQIEKLSSYKSLFRTRAGNYRIVYKKLTNRITIVLIGHRREVYKLLKDLLK